MSDQPPSTAELRTAPCPAHSTAPASRTSAISPSKRRIRRRMKLLLRTGNKSLRRPKAFF